MVKRLTDARLQASLFWRRRRHLSEILNKCKSRVIFVGYRANSGCVAPSCGREEKPRRDIEGGGREARQRCGSAVRMPWHRHGAAFSNSSRLRCIFIVCFNFVTTAASRGITEFST